MKVEKDIKRIWDRTTEIVAQAHCAGKAKYSKLICRSNPWAKQKIIR